MTLTPQEKIEGNKLIAEFMGATPLENDNHWFKGLDPYPHPMRETSLEYHTSWDWIMPVVEKIKNFKERRENGELRFFSSINISIESSNYMGYWFYLIGSITYCHNLQIPHTYTKVEIPAISIRKDSSTLLEHVFIGIINFITWYKQQSHE